MGTRRSGAEAGTLRFKLSYIDHGAWKLSLLPSNRYSYKLHIRPKYKQSKEHTPGMPVQLPLSTSLNVREWTLQPERISMVLYSFSLRDSDALALYLKNLSQLSAELSRPLKPYSACLNNIGEGTPGYKSLNLKRLLHHLPPQAGLDAKLLTMMRAEERWENRLLIAAYLAPRTPEILDELTGAYTAASSEQEQIAILVCLQQWGNPAACSFLLPICQSESIQALTAIKALATCGTLKTVGPLYEIAQSSRVNARHRTAARESIVQIQNRCGQGERGALSLSPKSQGGALSLAASHHEGELTLQESKSKVHPRPRFLDTINE